MALFRDNDTRFGIDLFGYDDGSFGSRHSALESDISHTSFNWFISINTVITTSTQKRLFHNILIQGRMSELGFTASNRTLHSLCAASVVDIVRHRWPN